MLHNFPVMLYCYSNQNTCIIVINYLVTVCMLNIKVRDISIILLQLFTGLINTSDIHYIKYVFVFCIIFLYTSQSAQT